MTGWQDQPANFETYGTRTLKLTFCNQKFSQEFIITNTGLPILWNNFLTRNNLTLNRVKGALIWATPAGREIQFS